MKSDAWNESISTIVYMRLIKTTSQQEINGIYEYFVLCNGSVSENFALLEQLFGWILEKNLNILNPKRTE